MPNHVRKLFKIKPKGGECSSHIPAEVLTAFDKALCERIHGPTLNEPCYEKVTNKECST